MISNSPAHLQLPGQAAAPDGPVDLVMMYTMHHAFRRDLGRFTHAAATTDPHDRSRWKALEQRWKLFATVLHHHHASEDAGLWPLLLARVAAAGDHDAGAVLAAMEAEHAQIDPLLTHVADGFARLARRTDAEALARLQRTLKEASQLLDAHLGHEERDAMALVQRHLDDSEWRRLEAEHFRPAYGLRQLLAVVPWAMLGLTAEARSRVFAAAGQPFRVLWWLTRRSFARREAAAFGTAPPWVADVRSPVAVVGATGTVGSLVLDELVAAHASVRVLVRRRRPDGTFPPEVTQVVADLHDEDALRAALTGVRAALYVSPHEADEETLAAAFVRATSSTGTRIVFAGVHVPARNPLEWLQLKLTARLLPTYRPKLRIGQLIAASHPEPVIFSPSNFFQNDEIFAEDIRQGTYPLPMRRVNRVDVRDLAELCARALLEPSYPAGQHTVAGPAALSGQGSAQTWAEALGRPVNYVGDDESVWVPLFRRRLSGQKLEDLVNTSRVLARHVVTMSRAIPATTDLLGHDARSYTDYVNERVDQTTNQAA